MDQGLRMQLMILWEERQKLGYDVIEPELGRYPVDMTIAATDGPDAIRQKLALLEDRLSLLRKEARQVEKRIRRMENRGRLEQEVWSLARQLLPEGAIGEVSSGAPPEAPAQGTAAVHLASDGGPVSPGDSPNPGRGLIEVRGADGVVAPRDFLLELHKLQARMKELIELEAVLEERIAAFREHLQLHLQELHLGSQ